MKGVARAVLALAGALTVAACVNQPPVALSSQFSPPARQTWLGRRPAGEVSGACRVHISEVRDLRTDPEAMGITAGRAIHAADTAAWVRSGFLALARDGRLQFVENPVQSDVVMDVEILKAYAMSVTGETRAASVVLRVRYNRNGAADGEQIYRGTENGVNWSSGEGETQSSFNAALADLLKAVNGDLVARCASGR